MLLLLNVVDIVLKNDYIYLCIHRKLLLLSLWLIYVEKNLRLANGWQKQKCKVDTDKILAQTKLHIETDNVNENLEAALCSPY